MAPTTISTSPNSLHFVPGLIVNDAKRGDVCFYPFMFWVQALRTLALSAHLLGVAS